MPPLGWNDILTIAAFLISLSVGAYQIKDYRARPAKPAITDIYDPGFRARVGDDTPDGCHHVQFDFHAVIENKGRNPFTIKHAILELETGETVELHSMQHSPEQAHSFEPNAVRDISYTAETTLPEDHRDEIRGTVRIETPAGDDEITKTFVLIEPVRI